MSSTSAQPDPHGSFSQGNAPQIVVRAEKHFLCSACGTLVEIPADVVGQLVFAAVPIQKEETADEPFDEPTKTQTAVSHAAASAKRATRTHTRSTSSTTHKRPASPKRPPQPQRATFVGQQIDGLLVPSGKQLDHAFHWITFHLKVLDRQGSEINRLKKLLKKPSVPCQRPREKTKSNVTHSIPASACSAKQTHAQADLGLVPENDLQSTNQAQERGPPD